MIPLWTLTEAQALVKQLQGKIWDCNFHVALGGSVLNHGSSDKDLDLYVLPLSTATPEYVAKVRTILVSVLGAESQLGVPACYGPVEERLIETAYPPCPVYGTYRYTYWNSGKRVDVFIAAQGV